MARLHCVAQSMKHWTEIHRAPHRSRFCCAGNNDSSSAPMAVDLSRHPEAHAIEVRPHDLETYDELARNDQDDNVPEQ